MYEADKNITALYSPTIMFVTGPFVTGLKPINGIVKNIKNNKTFSRFPIPKDFSKK